MGPLPPIGSMSSFCGMKNTKTATKSPSSISSSAEHVALGDPATLLGADTGSMGKSFTRYLPEAQALPKERVVPLRIDVAFLVKNVQLGLEAVQPFLTRLRAELPKLPVSDFAQLLPLAEAVLYASERAAQLSQPVRRVEIDAKLKELAVLREAMLLVAEGLAVHGLLQKRAVEQIRSGKGQYDLAMDGRALCDLYTEHKATLAGKHPFTEAEIKRIGELGQELMRVITPDGARLATQDEAVKAAEDRDRLYSLLCERHADLRKAGFYLFGEEVDQKVPTLGARAGRKRTEATPEEPKVGPPADAPKADAPKPA